MNTWISWETKLVNPNLFTRLFFFLYQQLHFCHPLIYNFRAKIFEDIDRMINPDCLVNRVVYDLDDIVKNNQSDARQPTLRNTDISRYSPTRQQYTVSELL